MDFSSIANILFQLFTFLMGPHGALILSVIFNILLVVGLFFLAKNYMEQMKQKDSQILEKDEKISDLLNDLKLLVIKSQLSADDFKKLLETQFFNVSDTDDNQKENNKKS